MQFGKIEDTSKINFILPPDPYANQAVLKRGQKDKPAVFIGATNWNRTALKNFYPKGVKDELAYYSTQFNCIELNATFYNNFPFDVIDGWRSKTTENFRFFPKVHQGVSHWKRLKDAAQPTSLYLDHISHLEEKMEMLFMQMPDNFGPENWMILRDYLEVWPSGFPLALELRHPAWYNGAWNNELLFAHLEKKNITLVITDTPGRQDVLHMRLTTTSAFIRYNSTNQDSDYHRLDQWVNRIKTWKDQGIENIYFFVHQNYDKEFPLLATYLNAKINKEFGINLVIPHNPHESSQLSLF
jgi:uncharacterized protein YecE (DUF72 family)